MLYPIELWVPPKALEGTNRPLAAQLLFWPKPALLFTFSVCLCRRFRKTPRMSKARSNKFVAYPRLNPLGVGKNISAADLIDQTFLAYNGGRLREAAKLLAEKMLPDDGF